jgi:hypothetical protein
VEIVRVIFLRLHTSEECIPGARDFDHFGVDQHPAAWEHEHRRSEERGIIERHRQRGDEHRRAGQDAEPAPHVKARRIPMLARSGRKLGSRGGRRRRGHVGGRCAVGVVDQTGESAPPTFRIRPRVVVASPLC